MIILTHFLFGYIKNCSIIKNIQKRELFSFSEMLVKKSKLIILMCNILLNKAYSGGGLQFNEAINRTVLIELCIFLENETKFYGPTLSMWMTYLSYFKKHNLTLLNHLCLKNLAIGGNCCEHFIFHNNSFFIMINSIMKSGRGYKNFSMGCAFELLCAGEKYAVIISKNTTFQDNQCINNQFYCFGYIRYLDFGSLFYDNKIEHQAGIFFLIYEANISLFKSIFKKNTARYSAIVLADHGSFLYAYNISVQECLSETRLFAFSQKSYFFINGMVLNNSLIHNKDGRIFDFKDVIVSIKNLLLLFLNQGSIFLLEKVKFNLEASIFQNYKDLFLKSSSSNLIIFNCSIQNSIILGIAKTYVFLIRENSKAKFVKVIFKNLTSDYSDFLIYLESSPLVVEMNIFENIFSKVVCGIFILC